MPPPAAITPATRSGHSSYFKLHEYDFAESLVAVDTSANTVMLSGHVRTWAEHDAVVDAAWMATGVYDVRDDLYITG
ncbi:MAG TPA: BON domain-containing protein [Trebonia sp.]|nr:BON domain-containing protein [Trebonia sp.]